MVGALKGTISLLLRLDASVSVRTDILEGAEVSLEVLNHYRACRRLNADEISIVRYAGSQSCEEPIGAENMKFLGLKDFIRVIMEWNHTGFHG